MKNIVKLGNEIETVGATTIFPGTKNMVCITFETGKTSYTFIIENDRARQLAQIIIDKADNKPSTFKSGLTLK